MSDQATNQEETVVQPQFIGEGIQELRAAAAQANAVLGKVNGIIDQIMQGKLEVAARLTHGPNGIEIVTRLCR